MKIISLRSLFWVTLFASALQLTSCKKDRPPIKPETPTTTALEPVPTPNPVTISLDEELLSDVTDAVKDFPGVSATVSDGAITLTGNISRERLPTLMDGLHSLHPKKINNNLTINK